MEELTTPITLDAELTLTDGTIESVDTIQIYFEETSARIANLCDFRVVFPDDFGFDQGSGAVKGFGCLGRTSSSAGSYSTITSGLTYPDTNDYAGGTFLAEDRCPAQSTDLECGIQITGIINPEFVATTDSLEIYLYDSSGGLIA